MSLKRRAPKVYTPAELIALVTEVQARQRLDSSKSVDAIARQLGIAGPTYFNWLRKGVRPAPAPVTVTQPVVLEREPASLDLRVKAARRYSQERRHEITTEIARLVGDGQTLTAALAAVDLGRTTYARWLELATPAPAFRAVTVVEAATPEITSVALVSRAEVTPAIAPPVYALTLVAPGGYRIEGLAIESAAALLRALS